MAPRGAVACEEGQASMVGGGDGVCYGSEVAQSTDDEMPTKSQASLCGRVKQ